MNEPLVVSFGGGVNSTALLVGLHDNAHRPDLILFADTGAEKPETYAFLDTFAVWLSSVGFPPVTRVSNDGVYKTLETECVSRQTLPSLAFGWRSCSDKYKKRPQHKFLAAWPPAQRVWEAGGRVAMYLGIDADETRRVKPDTDPRYRVEYPLVEWNWGRDECEAAIRRAGLVVPPKSACFFCPASSKSEVLQLATDHPELFARAVALEDGARPKLTTVRGLGRRYAWGELVVGRLPLETIDDPPEPPCGCFDG